MCSFVVVFQDNTVWSSNYSFDNCNSIF